MRGFLIPAILVCCASTAFVYELQAQVDVRKSAVSVEFAGVGLFGSVNYERVFFTNEKSFLNARVGIGLTDLRGPSFVHGITYCRGNTKHFLEAGLLGGLGTTTFGYADAPSTNYYLAPMLGYRRHPKKGLLFKLYACPLIPTADGSPVSFRLGIAIGFSF